MSNSLKKYNCIIQECKDIFIKKMNDYGIAWRLLRFSSITDQIYIKTKRIRTIQGKGKQKVSDNIRSEYIGIINYAIIALLQMEKGHLKLSPKLKLPKDITMKSVIKKYNSHVTRARDLYIDKTHDYDEAWKEMNPDSFTDLILVKLARMKQIQTNHGKTIISEGLEANLYDIVNYAIFALMRLS